MRKEGVAVGTCFDDKHSRKGQSIEQQKRKLNDESNISNNKKMKNQIDLYNRHWLYQRPDDMYQVVSAESLEKKCSRD